jgi:DNA-binding NtrC family response regulator
LLRVTSEPGNGTTFRLLFPRADAVRECGEPHHATKPARGKVLVADNEEFLRNVAELIVTPLGFEAVSATDAREALEKYAENPNAFGLVVLNLTMPRIDSEETLRDFARIRPNTKLLLIGDAREAELASEIAGIQVCSFVQKPFQLATFRERLKAALAAPNLGCAQD